MYVRIEGKSIPTNQAQALAFPRACSLYADLADAQEQASAMARAARCDSDPRGIRGAPPACTAERRHAAPAQPRSRTRHSAPLRASHSAREEKNESLYAQLFIAI
jgi:hypothetical protein